MRNGKKWATAASILLVTCALSSCTMPRSVYDLMGDERYLPEGSQQTFGSPRRPILNPLNNAPRALDQEEADHSYTAPLSRAASTNTVTASSTGIKRRVPSDNAAILSGNAAPAPATMAMAAPVTSVDEALAQKTVVTAEAPAAPVAPAAAPVVAATEAAPANTNPLVLMKPASDRPEGHVDSAVAVEQPVAVPVTEEVPASVLAAPAAEPAAAPAETSTTSTTEPAAATIKLIPPSSPKPGEVQSSEEQSSIASSSTVAMAETAAPVVHTKPAVDAVASTPADAAPTSYPSLSSIPDAPEATPAKQIASDIKSLDEDRKESQTANEQLMNDPSSTVLTSPKTGQLVSNAAEAMPAMAPAAGNAAPAAVAPITPAAPTSESSWLNNLLGPSDQKAAEAKQAEEERKAAETVAAALQAEPATQQDLTVPPVAAAAPATTEQTMAAAPSVLDQLKPAASETTAPATAAAANETAAIVAAANAEASSAPAAGTAPAATMDTVKLTPPVNVAEASVVKADKELTDIVEQPVEEVQPLPVKKVEYLPESRYAKRRLAPVNEAY